MREETPELREFVKENSHRLYGFCFYLLQEDYSVDDFVISVFRHFGEEYRKYMAKKEGSREFLELRVRLFRLAWEKIRALVGSTPYTWTVGRDMRQMKGYDDDLIESLGRGGSAPLDGMESAIVARLRKVDLEFRAPLVLRDVLGFDDEEVVRILGLRWGVFRHRLHRGRLDLRDELKGRAFPAEKKEGPGKETVW